jgi:hypothetical protein
MKFGLLLCMLLAGQMSFAQSIKEQKIKESMLNRVNAMIIDVSEARKDLQRLDAIGACERLERIFKALPDHLMAAGSHLYAFNNNTKRITNEALIDLIYVHQQTLVCKQGQNCEYVDPRAVGRRLKNMQSNLERHRKIILRSRTHYDNPFSYEYNF